ncbi:g-protein beta wd-40 repeat-containing protein [Stemphylium lycopersici]|nr:g-protein beta wd-40 repeat-containing protein [Stemphylium lycopersici]RAR02407.1 g-protein beta wd-40 repeat-containing protein [Stemphylium lycopersici]
MALVTRFLLPKHPKHTTTDEIFADGKAERQLQVTQISSSWKRLLLPKQDATKSQWVPNLSGIVKAGDEGLFSSALFTDLQGHPGQVPLDTLHQAFSSEIRTRPLAERSSYPGDMTKFLARTKKPANSVSRSKSMSQIKRVEPSQKSQRKSLDLSVAEMGLTRSLSIKKSTSALVSVRNGLQDDGSQKAAQKSWVKDGQTAKYHSGQTNVKVTPAELTALAIILGSEPNKNVDRQLAIPETSAYGISIISTRAEDSKHHMTLTQHKRSRSQRHAQGSGVSPLFAKHLAAGSLPYSQDKLGVHSILITDEAFEALQAGASLYTHPYVARTPQSKFLTSLPNSREPRFHILATSTEVHTSTTLLDAIAALPFSSGLAPLASAPLIKTVQFVASGGLPPAKLLQRLEGLVDKVHRHSPHLNIFGPLYEPQNAGVLYRERDRLGRLASDPSTPDTLADKTARMSRYMTLLERLMALVPDLKPQDVLEAVQEATKIEIQRSYERAVVAHTPQSHTRKSADFACRRLSDTQPKRHSTSPRSSPPRRSNRSSVLSNVTTPSVLSNEDKDRNLAKQLEQVLKAELPLDVAMIAFVARMVLVAWTLSVRVVAWEDGEEGYRVPDLEGWGKMIMS